jgi:hypothetical protein
MPEPEVTPTPDPVTPEPSPDEKAAAELEAAQQATAEEEQRRIAAEQNLAKVEAAKRELEFLDTVRDCARANGLKFYVPTKELVKLLAAEPQFNVDSQTGICHINGSKVELADALREFSQRHANLIERSAEQMRADREAANGAKSKAELRTWKEKSDYIDKFGLRAYEALPLKAARNVPISQMTNEDYHELSWAEKSKIIDRVGERGLVEIMNRRRNQK